jgi:hypothetical protein
MEALISEAGVAQLGQRRKTEALIPQGFVGSNPTSRTVMESLLETIKQKMLSILGFIYDVICLSYIARLTLCYLSISSC